MTSIEGTTGDVFGGAPPGPVPPTSAPAPFGPVAAPLAAAARPRRLVFTGSGSAYFRIWIVNVLLTIVTVGLYSPWAKVRRLRYFYGNTTVDGSPFEFHGRPLALLKGRLIALVLLVGYTQAQRISLWLWIAIVCGLVVLMPWLMWKSFRFRFANSSYRGIHFAFDGTLGRAYATFIPLLLMVVGPAAILAVVRDGTSVQPDLRVLGRYYAAVGVVLLLAPWFTYRLRAYQHGCARLGAAAFGFDGRVAGAYLLAFKLVLFGIACGLLAMLAGGVSGVGAWLVGRSLAPSIATTAGAIAGGAVAYLLLIAGIWGVGRAMTQNFVWNHTTLSGARFTSRVGRRRFWWIETGNLCLTLVTLGFWWPFAVVRSIRYRVEALDWTGDGDALVAGAAAPRPGATGEEAADLFGLDIAL